MSFENLDPKTVYAVLIAGKWLRVVDDSFTINGDWFRFTEQLYTQVPGGGGPMPTGSAAIAGPLTSIIAVRLKGEKAT